MLHVFYFLFACVKGPFCERKLPFLLTRYFFTRDAKYHFYLRKIQVNACFYPPPPLHPNTNPHPGSNACHACKKTWRQLLRSFFELFQSFSHTCASGIPPPKHQSVHNEIVRM